MTVEQIATVGVIIGTLSPFLTAVVNQPQWSKSVRRWVAIGVAVLLGIGTVIVGGDFDTSNWVLTLVAVVGAAQVAYAGLNPVTDRIERATSKRSNYTKAA